MAAFIRARGQRPLIIFEEHGVIEREPIQFIRSH
jgi:hypothetical protein